MTLLEVLVVVIVLAVLASMLLPAVSRTHGCSGRISCVNNLKQIGTAYRIWENDNGDKYPAQQTYTNGGMQELLKSSASAGQYTYLAYSIMQNEMGQSPEVVICPADLRMPNTNFYYDPRNAPKGWPEPQTYGSFANTNISYFIGVGAADTDPQSILGGDRNLGNGGVVDPKTGLVVTPEQDPDYGISGTTANPDLPCGADAIVNTNGCWVYASVSGGGGRVDVGHAVGWSAKMHSAGNKAGAGNILLGDGSSQQCTSAGLRANWMRNGVDTGNFSTGDLIHSTNRGDIRILFP